MVDYARDNKEATTAGLLSMVKQCDGKWDILYQIPLGSNAPSDILVFKNFNRKMW